MLVLDCAIFPALFLYKVYFHDPQIEYIHLLVTYHFGFTKRALIGTVVSWFAHKVPLWYVYAIGITIWIATLILFVVAFRRIFELTAKSFPLFVFMVGSPFFFKNFMYSIGYFDIYGCFFALVAILIPVGPLYPLTIASGCVGLILIHPVQFLLYVPTIGFIAAIRYGLLPGLSTGKVVCGLAVGLVLSVAFVAVAFFGLMPVPEETFLEYVRARAADKLDTGHALMWYRTIEQEIINTWSVMDRNIVRLPIFAALIFFHIPLIRCFKSMLATLATPFLRAASLVGLGAISVGYLAIFAVVYDYSRWFSNWAVCMFLAMHAVRLLPSSAADTGMPIRPDNIVNVALGWIVAAIPRVGTMKPF